MRKTKFDHAEKIQALTMVIKSICEENSLSRYVVIEDFIDLMEEKFEEESNA